MIKINKYKSILKFLFIILSFAWITTPTFSQINKIQAENDIPFFGNVDYQKASDLLEQNNPEEAFNSIVKASSSFLKEKKWKALISALEFSLYSFSEKENKKEILDFIEESITIIKEKAPDQLTHCDSLLDNLGSFCIHNYFVQSSINAFLNYLDIIKEKHPFEQTIDYVHAYNGLGIAYRNAGQTDKPLEYFLKSKKILHNLSAYENQDYQLAQTCEHLGHFYCVLGDYETAIIITREGLEYAIKVHGENSLNLAPFYQNLASQYGTIGEYKMNIEYTKKAIHLIESSGITEGYYVDKFLPGLYVGIAGEYAQNNQEEKAIEIYNKIINSKDKNKSGWHSTSYSYGGLAHLYLRKNDLNTSLKYFIKADSFLLEYPENIKEDTYFITTHAMAKLDLANIYKQLGNFKRALEYFRQATHIMSIYGEDLSGMKANIQNSISHIFELKGELDSAFYYNQSALNASCFNHGAVDIDYIPKVSEFIPNLDVYNILNQKVNLLRIQSQNETNPTLQKEGMTKALSYISLLDEVHIENIKTMNVLRGSQSQSLVEASITAYGNGLHILNELSQSITSEQYLEQSFYYIQKMKAQQLWLTQLNNTASSDSNVPLSVVNEERDLLNDILHYEKLAFDAREQNDFDSLDIIENNYLFNLKIKHNNFIEKIEKDYPLYFESKYNLVSKTINDLKNSISKNELIIEYVFTSDSDLFAFTIDKENSPQFIKIPVEETLGNDVENFYSLLQKSSLQRKKNLSKFVNLSHKLYNTFIQPIESQLLDKNRLIVIGDKMSYYIPFEVLLSSNEVNPFSDLPYLIKDYEITYHYSSTLFDKARSTNYTYKNNFFAFAPVYDNDLSQSIASVDNQRIDTTLRAFNSDGSLIPLFESENEVIQIVNLFKDNKDKNVLALRTDANEENIKKHITQDFKFVHIAGHSFANIKYPKFSGIACYNSTDKNQYANDDIFYSGEIQNIRIKTDLVTLSSCESGLGKMDKTEGLLGLNRSFLNTGAQNVVFSLWKVYDKVSSDLMIDFYEEILKGQTYSQALRTAKLKLISKSETASPNYWSAFLLIGR